MPSYTAEDTETGSVVAFDWYHDTPPTELDMVQIFAEARATKARQKNIVGTPQWGQDKPTLYGTYGAGKGLIRHGVKPVAEAVGAIVGSFAGPVAGTALGYGMGKKTGEIIEDAYARLGGEPSGFDKPVTASGVTTELGKSAVDVGAALALGKAFDVAGKSLWTAEQKLTDVVRKNVEKAIRPTVAGKKTAPRTEQYFDRAVNAVKTIVKNKPNLVFTDSKGNAVSGRLPRTLKEFAQAINQTKQSIFSQYDSLMKASGTKGTIIDLKPIVAELKTLLDDPAMAAAPNAKNHARRFINDFTEATKGQLSYTPGEAQRAIAMINNRLQEYYKKDVANYANAKTVDDLVVTHLRKYLDDAVSATEGAGYQELKNAYGALRTIEDEVSHRSMVHARKNKVGFFGYAHIWSAAEAIQAITDPTKLARAGAIEGARKWINYVNSPNRMVNSMFRQSEKLMDRMTKDAQKRMVKTDPVLRLDFPEIHPKVGQPLAQPGPQTARAPSQAPLRTDVRQLPEGQPYQVATKPEQLTPDQRATVLSGKMALRRAQEAEARTGQPLYTPKPTQERSVLPSIETELVERGIPDITQKAVRAKILGKIPAPDQGANRVIRTRAVQEFRKKAGLEPAESIPRGLIDQLRRERVLESINKFRRSKGLAEISFAQLLKQLR